MAFLEAYRGQTPAWCTGCGNFGILQAFQQAVTELGWQPHQFLIVSGIGQAGKFPHYLRCNTFNGLHGRSLPVATGIRLVNSRMPVFCSAGDGDCYGEGGNHLLAAIRRNINLKLLVHDNQVYGLTKGQASPTSAAGTASKTQPFGDLSQPLNPMALAVAMDASFVARGFSGNLEQLQELIVEAAKHQGFALLDILQPCVSFNKVNTYEWYRQRVVPLEPGYDPTDRLTAFARALEFDDRIPTGVLYRHQRPTFEEQISVSQQGLLADQSFDRGKAEALLADFV
jgi:2-oxoglutarate ferredoxin oxidoreductase subunit beta